MVGGENVAKQLYDYVNRDDVFGIRLLGIFCNKDITFDLKDNIKQGNLDDISEFAIKNIDQVKRFLLDNTELGEQTSKIIVFSNNRWDLIVNEILFKFE